jgi:NitT/TauT family transport system substrate-binding protein
MKQNVALGIVGLVVLAVAGLGAWSLTLPQPVDSGTPERVTIGIAPVELAGLIYIAEDQGFFPGNALDARVIDYDSALSAVGGMKKGEVDISVSTEYPLIAEMFGPGDIRVIGCIDKYQTTYLVGMRDRGILNRSDIAGKKIGVARGSVGEFYLGRFLNLQGMSLREVTLVDLKPAQLMGALDERSIDAAIVWNIDPEGIQERLGGNAVIWPAQSGQPTFGIMAGRSDWVESHGASVRKALQSIGEAEAYAISHPAEARMIVKRRLNATDAHMAAAWPMHQFSLSLDQSLLTAMEDEGRWMINNDLTPGKTVPDFRAYIYTKGLEDVKPGSVYFIR